LPERREVIMIEVGVGQEDKVNGRQLPDCEGRRHEPPEPHRGEAQEADADLLAEGRVG
jgi:hypothetical protein